MKLLLQFLLRFRENKLLLQLSKWYEIFTGTRGNPSLDTLMSMLSGLGSGGGLGVPNTSNGEYTLLLKNLD